MRVLTAIALISLCELTIAAEPALSTAQRRERVQTIRAMMQSFKPMLGEEGSLKPLTLAAEPALLYADNERDLSDASVWAWEADGKLAALSGAEWRPKEGTGGIWSFECASLSPDSIRVTIPTGDWTFKKGAVRLQAVTGAPVAAMSRPQRLVQLRKIADRFTAASFSSLQGRIELRRLAAPLYRQAESVAGDSALFAFANGTNPEVLLLLSTEGASMPWNYTVASLSGDGASAQLDEQEVWRVEKYTGPNSRPAYINGRLKSEPLP
ncbi:MAG TPA: hypothetical protein VFG20_02035 [Planctomycetaceae bacterium]|nr:hypothetical protein [Planctomycetaceae bacterium]